MCKHQLYPCGLRCWFWICVHTVISSLRVRQKTMIPGLHFVIISLILQKLGRVCLALARVKTTGPI